MPDDIAGQVLTRPAAAHDISGAPPSHWRLLGKLENASIGRGAADGTITVGRREAVGCFLYGPYLHLPQGRYRLTFHCRSRAPRMTGQPVLGVEIIVLSRFQQQWRDFTARDLATGVATLDFAVPPEHSLESENEGRFEFRFYHFGNADLAVTAVELESLQPEQAWFDEPRRWRLLGRMQKSWRGRRFADGRVSTCKFEPAGCLLYGGWPYLRLPRGRYRLVLRARVESADDAGRPVLGIEVLAQNRWRSHPGLMMLTRVPATNGIQMSWRDVTAEQIAAGPITVDFVVPTEISLEAGADAPFEIRLHHLGNNALTIDAVDLVELSDDEPVDAAPSTWHLLGRLQPGRIGKYRDGSLAVDPGEEQAPLLVDRFGLLRLPEGRFQVAISGWAQNCSGTDTALLRIDVTARPPIAANWLGPLRPRTIASQTIGAAELRAGSFAFDVPAALALGSGNWRVAIAVHHLGNGGFTLDAVDVSQIREETDIAAPRLRPAGRRKIVIIGNCQSETLRQGFVHTEALNKLFDVKYHFIQLPKNLHEFAARDLETCDVLLIQDIRLWDEFPLRDRVRPGADVVRFPLVRFASPWPFDAWNGPGDKVAYEQEAPNLAFPYLDGLLGRLRKEIPDPNTRFNAYRSLEFPGVINYRRLHEMEARRLVGMDKKFDVSIGSFILENFRNRRVFHTTVRPNWEVFGLMIEYVARQVGAGGPISASESMDAALRNPQIPVHPKIAHDLGIKWADENTRYLNRGREITWENYIRSYIEHYG